MSIEERIEALEAFRENAVVVFDNTFAVLRSIETTLSTANLSDMALVEDVVASLQSQSADLALIRAQLG